MAGTQPIGIRQKILTPERGASRVLKKPGAAGECLCWSESIHNKPIQAGLAKWQDHDAEVTFPQNA